MKKLVIALWFLLAFELFSFGQSTDEPVDKCISSAGSDTKYLKDFRVQLGNAAPQGDLRYKANMSLWKNMKYRFTMCCADDSKGLLILSVTDESNNTVVSSYDQKTGKAYTSVEFTCNKSGIYHLGFDFTNKQQGSGVGVVSVVQ